MRDSDRQQAITILITCFNRCGTTLSALSALDIAVGDAAAYRVVLVDDGSTDGTSSEVRSAFPDVIVIPGAGDLYWNGGMRLAWSSALELGLESDFYLWLNDDTQLRPNSISDLLSLYRQQDDPRTIVVGCTVDPSTQKITYGGYRHSEGSLSKLRFRRLSSQEAECDTMNGNCVLIPARAVTEIGINSSSFRHSYGDNDYGLRAKRAGWKIVELKAPVAFQSENIKYKESISRLNFDNWRFILMHPKGVSLREWWSFCRMHAGLLAPVNFITRYLKMALARS